VATALTCLRGFGIDMPASPTEEEAQAEYEMVWHVLNGRPIESLIDLPVMTDPQLQVAMQVLGDAIPAAYLTDFRFCCLLMCRIVRVSMQCGVSGASAQAFGRWGTMLGPVFHRYRDGYRFAQLASDMIEKHGFIAYRARSDFSMGRVVFWTQPLTTVIDHVRAAFRPAIETGDLTLACFSKFQLVAGLLLRADPLNAVSRESEMALDFARETKYAADIVESQHDFIAVMQGRIGISIFSEEPFENAALEAQQTGDRLPLMICWYWILELKARFLLGDYASALAAFAKAKPILSAAGDQIQLLDYFYYASLTVAACYENASADEQQESRELLATHQEQLREWAESYPPTFADKHALVSAEIARLEGRDADAMRLYEEAIRSARDHGFVQNEGLVYEVAARFYAARGFETIAHAYLRNARSCYLRWGADGKVRQLDRLHPSLAATDEHRAGSATGHPVQLDVASVVKASQALSNEIILPKLIERLMTIALENAGADRGLLILLTEDDPLIEAEAQATDEKIEVVLCQRSIIGITCPESVVRYVIRTQERVILDDASKPNLFSEDDYLRDRQTKSVLCLPLIKQGRSTGLLYLENTLTAYAFTPDRTAILELLAAQAAISLENTRLYSDLQEREAKARHLVDSNIIGICNWDVEGRILEANDSFLDMVGHNRDDLVSGRVRWTALTPSEWKAADDRALAEFRATGTCKAYEKEYFRKDGTRVPVLIGAASFDARRAEGVAFVLDLTQRKQADEKLRESEQRYREAELALVHANRVTTMGQLTASIAHEVSQPVAAAVTNAHAALRWLGAHPPDLGEARKGLDAIIKAGNRAGDVIGRIRALVKKAAPRSDPLYVNETILEVIEVTRSELIRNGVSLRTELAEGLPLVQGDRIQLQQIALNLMMNASEAMSDISKGSRDLLISTARDRSGGVLVAVRDSGPGLNTESLARLFDPFYTTKPGGMGMGLSICRSIIEAHGGRIWAEANLPQGTTFQFIIPAQTAS
jgi:PAS domain S-box-containing protein